MAILDAYDGGKGLEVTDALPGPGRLARRLGTSAAEMAEPLVRESCVWLHARAVEATRTVQGPRQRVRFVQGGRLS